MTHAEHAQLLRELCDSHADALDFTVSSYTRRHMQQLIARARAAAKELEEAEHCYEFQVFLDEDWVAGGTAPTLQEAEREGRHYLSLYSQDGECEVLLQGTTELARFKD